VGEKLNDKEPSPGRPDETGLVMRAGNEFHFAASAPAFAT
jgi:hypothetical protein